MYTVVHIAHARRKFSDNIPKNITIISATLAQTGSKKIAAIFRIEKDIEKMSSEDKAKVKKGNYSMTSFYGVKSIKKKC